MQPARRSTAERCVDNAGCRARIWMILFFQKKFPGGFDFSGYQKINKNLFFAGFYRYIFNFFGACGAIICFFFLLHAATLFFGCACKGLCKVPFKFPCGVSGRQQDKMKGYGNWTQVCVPNSRGFDSIRTRLIRTYPAICTTYPQRCPLFVW